MLRGYNILVAEDNALNQRIATILLQKQGALVTTAKNGVEAIKQLEQHHFDLVLMDLQMPEMDGYETTIHIRKVLHNNLPIIALSATDFDYDRAECMKAGMDDCISKPFDSKQLCELIISISKEKKLLPE